MWDQAPVFSQLSAARTYSQGREPLGYELPGPDASLETQSTVSSLRLNAASFAPSPGEHQVRGIPGSSVRDRGADPAAAAQKTPHDGQLQICREQRTTCFPPALEVHPSLPFCLDPLLPLFLPRACSAGCSSGSQLHGFFSPVLMNIHFRLGPPPTRASLLITSLCSFILAVTTAQGQVS